MFTFLQFIVEAKKPSLAKTAELGSDDKGKLHELLLAKHLHPKTQLPSHWRSKSEDYGGTPEDVHDRLKTKIGEAAYNEINTHAKQTAGEIKTHMAEVGHIGGNTGHEIHDVHWTSNRDSEHNPGDHQLTTGIKDRNSNADLIITTKHKDTRETKFVGISAKYGSQAKPNFKNAGLDSLEKEGKQPKGKYTSLLKTHGSNMARIGYTGTNKERHQKYKTDVVARQTKPNSVAAKRSIEAEEASKKMRSKMAAVHRTGLSARNDSQLRQLIRGNVSPETKIPHIIAHSHVQNDGSAVSRVHPAESIADDHLKNFSNLHVNTKEKGIRATIRGTTKTGKNKGKIVTVASQTFKAGSGPMKGVAGVFKLG